jgi:nucleoside-triphosphatase
VNPTPINSPESQAKVFENFRKANGFGGERMGRTILLTGAPGVGKTTVLQRIVERLPGRAGGFYTAEIRQHGQRLGFRIITLDGCEGVLAHIDIAGPSRVSRYGVNQHDLEAIGVRAVLDAIEHADVVVIDEIGKMELFSPSFREAVRRAIESDRIILGTIMLAAHPWADTIKAHRAVTVIHVTRENRHRVVEQVLSMLGAPW